jgi:hypothetical protein
MDGGGGVTVGECFSFDCKMNLYVLDGSMTGQTYRDNIIRDNVVSYFDNKTDIHGLITKNNVQIHNFIMAILIYYNFDSFNQYNDFK